MKLNTLFNALFLFISSAFAGYQYEEIELPLHVDPQIGGLATLPNGNIIACFHRGEVMIYDVKSKEWSLFAEGLHEPLGIVALSNSEFMVMQRPELTKLIDTDQDGQADKYETFFDGFGMTGNYHEFSFGPVMDKAGNFYISLNVASNGASIRKEVRGEFIDIGMKREKFYSVESKNWKSIKKDAGRMYSRVPYRGWVLKISPEGKMIPISSGVRSPNGLGFDAHENLYVPDNQGDWLGTSKIHLIKPGRFHGHPASLVWRKDWDGRDPLEVPVKELDAMRTKAAILSPQGIIANSLTQPILIDHKNFGPYKGQMLIGEMNFKKILRFIPDEVNGTIQGPIFSHLENDPMKIGNNRMTWGKDGSLFIGRTKLSWAGDRGITKVTWDGKVDFDIQNFKLSKKGFDITFTKKVHLPESENLKITNYHYLYHSSYGSPKTDETTNLIKAIRPSSDGKTLHLELDQLTKGKVYEFSFDGIKSKSGESLKIDKICYTLNELK